MSEETTPPFVPPASPEEYERLMDREIAEHADRIVEFLLRYEAGLVPIDEAAGEPPDPRSST